MYANAHENASAVTIHEVIEPAIAIASDGLPRHRVNFFWGSAVGKGFVAIWGEPPGCFIEAPRINQNLYYRWSKDR
jgi:hypothetical protein